MSSVLYVICTLCHLYFMTSVLYVVCTLSSVLYVICTLCHLYITLSEHCHLYIMSSVHYIICILHYLYIMSSVHNVMYDTFNLYTVCFITVPACVVFSDMCLPSVLQQHGGVESYRGVVLLYTVLFSVTCVCRVYCSSMAASSRIVVLYYCTLCCFQ